jgi:hypothetical protein
VPEVQLPGLGWGNAGDQEQEQGGKKEKESHRESATGDEWESPSMYKYSSMKCLSFYTVRPVPATQSSPGPRRFFRRGCAKNNLSEKISENISKQYALRPVTG